MGFEPTVFFNTLVFKTNTLNHSAIYPKTKKKGLEPLTTVLETAILPIKLFFQKLDLKGFEPLFLLL